MAPSSKGDFTTAAFRGLGASIQSFHQLISNLEGDIQVSTEYSILTALKQNFSDLGLSLTVLQHSLNEYISNAEKDLLVFGNLKVLMKQTDAALKLLTELSDFPSARERHWSQTSQLPAKNVLIEVFGALLRANTQALIVQSKLDLVYALASFQACLKGNDGHTKAKVQGQLSPANVANALDIFQASDFEPSAFPYISLNYDPTDALHKLFPAERQLKEVPLKEIFKSQAVIPCFKGLVIICRLGGAVDDFDIGAYLSDDVFFVYSRKGVDRDLPLSQSQKLLQFIEGIEVRKYIRTLLYHQSVPDLSTVIDKELTWFWEPSNLLLLEDYKFSGAYKWSRTAPALRTLRTSIERKCTVPNLLREFYEKTYVQSYQRGVHNVSGDDGFEISIRPKSSEGHLKPITSSDFPNEKFRKIRRRLAAKLITSQKKDAPRLVEDSTSEEEPECVERSLSDGKCMGSDGKKQTFEVELSHHFDVRKPLTASERVLSTAESLKLKLARSAFSDGKKQTFEVELSHHFDERKPLTALERVLSTAESLNLKLARSAFSRGNTRTACPEDGSYMSFAEVMLCLTREQDLSLSATDLELLHRLEGCEHFKGGDCVTQMQVSGLCVEILKGTEMPPELEDSVIFDYGPRQRKVHFIPSKLTALGLSVLFWILVPGSIAKDSMLRVVEQVTFSNCLVRYLSRKKLSGHGKKVVIPMGWLYTFGISDTFLLEHGEHADTAALLANNIPMRTETSTNRRPESLRSQNVFESRLRRRNRERDGIHLCRDSVTLYVDAENRLILDVVPKRRFEIASGSLNANALFMGFSMQIQNSQAYSEAVRRQAASQPIRFVSISHFLRHHLHGSRNWSLGGRMSWFKEAISKKAVFPSGEYGGFVEAFTGARCRRDQKVDMFPEAKDCRVEKDVLLHFYAARQLMGDDGELMFLYVDNNWDICAHAECCERKYYNNVMLCSHCTEWRTEYYAARCKLTATGLWQVTGGFERRALPESAEQLDKDIG